MLAGDRAISDEDRREYASRIHAAAIEIRELVDALEDGDAARVERTFREHSITSADELIALRDPTAAPGENERTTA